MLNVVDPSPAPHVATIAANSAAIRDAVEGCAAAQAGPKETPAQSPPRSGSCVFVLFGSHDVGTKRKAKQPAKSARCAICERRLPRQRAFRQQPCQDVSNISPKMGSPYGSECPFRRKNRAGRPTRHGGHCGPAPLHISISYYTWSIRLIHVFIVKANTNHNIQQQNSFRFDVQSYKLCSSSSHISSFFINNIVAFVFLHSF